MIAGAATLGLSFVAGALSTLSPCVLPLLPILLGAALTEHRYGPLALAAGLGLSFTVAGVLLASVGLYFGFDPGWLRGVGAAILVAVGIVLLSASLQRRFAAGTAGVGRAGDAVARRLALRGLPGQFALGVVLGLVWAPCVGPTLGAAVTLASQGEALVQVAAVMLVFGIGAALPLAALGTLSRETMLRGRGALLRAGAAGKLILGVLLVTVGVAILAGVDRRVEAALVELSPDWLGRLTTRF